MLLLQTASFMKSQFMELCTVTTVIIKLSQPVHGIAVCYYKIIQVHGIAYYYYKIISKFIELYLL